MSEIVGPKFTFKDFFSLFFSSFGLIGLIGLILIFSHHLNAQDLTLRNQDNRNSLDQSTRNLSHLISDLNSHFDHSSYFGLQSLTYINDSFSSPEQRTSYSMDFHLYQVADTDDREENKNFLGLDLRAQLQKNNTSGIQRLERKESQEWLTHLTLNEFYVRINSNIKNTKIKFGRYRSTWSRLDDLWSIGAFQPINRVDPLNSVSQGLTGIFIDIKTDYFKLGFFGSNIFLPDQGPEIEIANGKFKNRDPWFFYPPSNSNINGVQTPIEYTLDKPSVKDVVLNRSYGANLQIGELDQEGLTANIAWSNKPMNQLLLGLNGFLILEQQLNQVKSSIDVQLHPEIGFHTVRSFDLNYKLKRIFFNFGVIEDVPERKQFPSKWTYQNHASSKLTGVGITFMSEDDWKLGLHHLKKIGGESHVFGPEKEFVENLIPERYSFNELAKLEINYHKSISLKWKFDFFTELKRELIEGSELLSFKSAFLYNKLWNFYLGMDLLKSENKDLKKSDFIESHLSNDRVYGGFQYVF